MSLEATLTDIIVRLRQGRFPNEQAISQGIVLRLLQEVGWNTWDTARVWPEFQTGEGRCDFALCHPPTKPKLFIEVKQPGKAEDAVRQALEYAFHTGVQFVVLTDGKTWSFYLPAEAGSYEERRVYKLDLFERSPSEAADILLRYLAHTKVESGESLETARQEYRARNRKLLACNAIPGAWRELVEKGDELLVEILASSVESKVGVRPEDDDVAEFLTRLGRSLVEGGAPRPERQPSFKNQNVQTATDLARAGRLLISGKGHSYRNATEAMVVVLTELAKADASFLERRSKHPEAQGRKRRYIARTREELYPDRPDLREYSKELPGGWLVATNLNNVLKRNIIKFAAEVAGLVFGKDIVVGF